uniref:Candidate secreted effector n=1 Tax=Meloidogyne incognita TaxID=6306 RepID=A0A914LQR9_MELIC
MCTSARFCSSVGEISTYGAEKRRGSGEDVVVSDNSGTCNPPSCSPLPKKRCRPLPTLFPLAQSSTAEGVTCALAEPSVVLVEYCRS